MMDNESARRIEILNTHLGMNRMTNITPSEITGNVFTRLNKQWMLITSERDSEVNAMTASWGGFGVIWNMPVAYVLVRPQRYTFELMEASDRFGLSFLTEQYRAALQVCGTKSGRERDKLKAVGLTTRRLDGATVIEQAELVISCKKLYSQFLADAGFVRRELLQIHYPGNDLHKLYIGEITAVEIER